MRLVCPKCHAEYDVDAALIPEEGREVQCASCQNIWFQEKQKSPPPLVLKPAQPTKQPEDVPAAREDLARDRTSPFQDALRQAADATPDVSQEGSAPAPVLSRSTPKSVVPKSVRPSDAVPPEERTFLREAAQEEVELARDQSGAGRDTPAPASGPVPHTPSFAAAARPSELRDSRPEERPTPEAPSVPQEDEEDLLRSLRAQLAIGDDEPSGGPVRSSRRSVAEAAASAGIRGVLPGDAEPAPAERGTRRADVMSRYFDDDDEDEYETAGRGRSGLGLFVALSLGIVALGVYRFEPMIAEAVPEAAPYLTQYVAAVDQARISVEGLYAQARETISGMTSDDAASG